MANGQSLYQVVNGVDPLAPLPAPEQPKMGRGQLIAGILADMLAGAMGRPGQFAATLNQQRQQEQEDVRWGRRLEQEQQIKARYPDVSPMERDAQAWARMTPQERQAYMEYKSQSTPDPDVAVTLPNGQFYAGPRSGLAQALQGYSAPTKPVGKLTPINGGPTPPASGGFRY